MRQLLILLSLCLSSALMAQNAAHIQEAMANYDYETAISLINKEKPTVSLLMQKGKAQKGLGSNMEAFKTFRQVIATDSTNMQAHIEAAECCKTLAKYKEALEYYRKALDLNPKNKYARIQFISLLCQTGDFAEAFGESSDMAETDSSAIVLHLQGQSLEGMQEVLPAIGCYHVIQEKYPDDYLAAAKLGNLYISQKSYDYAIEATERYRKLDSINIVVNQQNALAYCLDKQYSTAIDRYETLSQQGDSTAQTIYYLGISYYAKEKYYEAHDCFKYLLEYKPDDTNLLYYLARCCAKTSWKKEGVEYMEEAIRLTIPTDSTMIRLYKGLVDCCKLADNGNKQIEAIKELYKYNPTNHKLLYDIAWIYRYNLKNIKMTEQYLVAFLKTKSQANLNKEPAVDQDGVVIMGLESYYNAAAKWLNDIRKENFFKEGTPVPQ